MVKQIFAALTLFLVLPAPVRAQVPIEIDMDLPAGVEAGESFIVTVKIRKGPLEEFSRFQQELPGGLTAEPINSGTADYSFEGQRVRFIWLKLPADELISLAYRVNVHQRLKGSFSLSGEFSYIEENERKMIEVASDPVEITPSPDVTADRQIDISRFDQAMASGQASAGAGREISCIRQSPYLSAAGNELIVNLLVYKNGLDRFAKIEENIPEGFEARSLESKDAIFTFQDGIARFVWMNLPAGKGFSIAYRLVPVREQSLDELRITGKFSYISGGQNITADIMQRNVDLSHVDPSGVDRLMARIESGEAVSPDPVDLPGTISPPGSPLTPETSPETTGKTLEAEEIPPAVYKRIPPALQPEVIDGIYYRIQVAAFRSQQDPARIFGGGILGKPVKIEYHEGLYKYSIGSFASYDAATAFKDELLKNRELSDAFITAYRNGRRISVQEAITPGQGDQ